jgi:hypothetical protein
MNNLTGAQRPAFKRKILLIAVTAIVLVFAWAKAGYPCNPCPWFQLGPDGVMGMMPPNGYGRPAPGGGGNTRGGNNGPMTVQGVAGSKGNANVQPSDLTLTQTEGRHSYKYVASENGSVYLIKRDGVPWVTVTYNATTKLYELTDPRGSGAPVLKVGANATHPENPINPKSETH